MSVNSVIRVVRVLLAVVVGVVAFLGTVVGACDDIGGVPVWDRCTSWLGTPAFVEWPAGILDLIIPLAIGTALGTVAWWLLGLFNAPDRDS